MRAKPSVDEGGAVRTNPDSVAVVLIVEQRAVEVADDAAVLFGDPRLAGRLV
jgi:hypothetical protein